MDDTGETGTDTASARHGATQRDTPRHTLTIRQARQLFISFGVPRSTRSIQRFCEIGSIECIRVKGEKVERYFIDRPSVERYATELKQLEAISHIADDGMRHDASRRDEARHGATSSGDPISAAAAAPTRAPDGDEAALGARVNALEKENFQLQIDRSAKEQVIGHMMEERRGFLAQLTDQSREIGRLETNLRQLSPPQRDMSRHDTTDTEASVVAMMEAQPRDAIDVKRHPTPPQPSTSVEPKRSAWARLFG